MLRNLLIAVLLIFGSATINFAQLTCPGDLTVVVEGSGTDLALALSVDVTEPECNTLSTPTLSGSIDLTVTGGTEDYSYDWQFNGTDFSTDEDLFELGTGTYSVTVTDAVGCEMTGSWDILEPLPVTVSGTTEDLSCNSASGDPDGIINITPGGGQGAPFTYSWEALDGGLGLDVTAQNQTGLTAGMYQVTVSDVNLCTAVALFDLTQPDAINAIANAIDPICNELSTPTPMGSITLEVVGGDEDYSYNWETTDGSGLINGDEDQTGLTAGTYFLTITDGNNCTLEVDYTLSEPAIVTVVGTPQDPGCNAASGAADGSITSVIAGGGIGTNPGDYTYTWTTTGGSGLVAGQADQTGLSEGVYTIVVTDGNGCTATETWELFEPDAVSCSLDSPILGDGTNVACFNDTGIITVTPLGGTPDYEYQIDGTDYLGNAVSIGPQTGNTFEVLAGVYTVTTFDDNGCSSTCDYTLTQPDELIAGTCTTDDECQVDAGEIEVEVAGGVGPYTVTWTTTTAGATLDQASQVVNASGGSVIFTGAQGGATYIFTVEDENGCIIGG